MSPKDCIYVGDAPSDGKAARATANAGEDEGYSLSDLECEKEWRYVERTETDNDGHTRRRRVREKHTIRTTVLDDKNSDSYDINSGCHFFRVLCCEYSSNAELYTFCPECGEPGSDCAYLNCC